MNQMSHLGNKHECYECGAKFYDLGKPEALCPKCGANQKNASPKSSHAESAAKKKRREREDAPVKRARVVSGDTDVDADAETDAVVEDEVDVIGPLDEDEPLEIDADDEEEDADDEEE